jgi:hypothetical protein
LVSTPVSGQGTSFDDPCYPISAIARCEY